MKFFKKSDLIFIVLLIALGLGGLAFYYLFPAKGELTAEIYYDSELLARMPLSGEEGSFSLPGHENILFHVSKEKTIAFERSDCPDQICVHTGALRLAGQSAACLPNKMIVKIVSVKEPDLDGEVQ